MMLFPELEACPATAMRRVPVPGMTWRQAVSVLLQLKLPRWEQLPLRMPLRALERDVDTAFDFPAHSVLPAAAAEKPATLAAPSIFALAQSMKGLRRRGRFGDAAGFKPTPPPYRVERDGDRTRVVRLRQDETPEWREKEAARRARQRPPKPTKKARTRSAKLRELVGDDQDE